MSVNQLLILVLILFTVTACHSSQDAVADSKINKGLSLYIDKVSIVDLSTGKIIENRQLLIRDGKIVAINPAESSITEKDFILQDAKGRYLIPGLIDMHVHAYDPAAFTIALSHGVTHLRLMNGVKDHLVWRSELEQGVRIGSSITVSSPTMSGFNNAHMHYPVHTPDEAVTAVIKARHQGYDLIKAYGNLTAPVLDALLNEAKKQKISVGKHGPYPADGLEWNKLAGLQSLEHVEDIYQGPLNYQQDQNLLDQTISQIKNLHTPVTPTLNIFWQLTKIGEQKKSYLDTLPEGYISPIISLEDKRNQVKRWLNSSAEMTERNKETLAFLQEITRRLYEADVTLLVGTDSGELLSPHGLATHNEMRLMHESGIPILDVLRAATINPAKALGKEREFGQIAVGYHADLILSEENPLEDLESLRNPVAVVKRGRFFSSVELQKLREKAIEERSIWQEMKTLLHAGKL